MNPNDEIVKLATEWAKDILDESARSPLRYESDKRKAREILALTAPAERELMPWPGMRGKIEVLQSTITKLWWVELRDAHDRMLVCLNVLALTRAAAIDAWDEVMMRLAGTGIDAETRRLMDELFYAHNFYCAHPTVKKYREWLDAHPDGGGA